MRVSLPVTLFASLALHLSLAAGIVFSIVHGGSAPTAPATPSATTPTVTLLRSEETPAVPTPRAASIRPTAPLTASAPANAPPVPPQPDAAKKLSVEPSRPASLALEANPNAHVRPFAPDAILSPSPAPHLNNAAAIVFILDISGSMYEPYAGSTRIALARENLCRQIRALKDGKPFAVTLYALNACASGPLVAASDATREAAVRFVMHDVDCGGGTNLPAGLAAAEQLHPGALVLVTDGDLNAPAYVLEGKSRDILGSAGHGPALAVIGIAPRDNQKASRLLQGLADVQGGSYVGAELPAPSELVTSAATVIKPATATP